MSNQRDFDAMFYDCVNSVFIKILGEQITITVLNHLGVSNSKVKVEVFSESLERLFGPGAHVLEQMVLQNLYTTAGRTFQEEESFKFIDYVNEIRTLMASENK